MGNTCFFNAVLQCLARTPYLVKVLDDLCTPGEKFILPGGKFKPDPNGEEVELVWLINKEIVYKYFTFICVNIYMHAYLFIYLFI